MIAAVAEALEIGQIGKEATFHKDDRTVHMGRQEKLLWSRRGDPAVFRLDPFDQVPVGHFPKTAAVSIRPIEDLDTAGL